MVFDLIVMDFYSIVDDVLHLVCLVNASLLVGIQV